MFTMFSICIAIPRIDWSDALTQFKNYRLWGAYPISKIFQILSTYKLKHDLLKSM